MICVHDVSTVYRVPLLLEDQGVVSYFCQRLNLPVAVKTKKMLSKWKEMSDRWERLSYPLPFSDSTSCSRTVIVWVETTDLLLMDHHFNHPVTSGNRVTYQTWCILKGNKKLLSAIAVLHIGICYNTEHGILLCEHQTVHQRVYVKYLISQIWPSPGVCFHSPGGEIHKVIRRLHLSDQGYGALRPRH